MKKQNEDRNSQNLYDELLVTLIGAVGVLSAFGIWMSTNKLYTVIFTVATIATFGIVLARVYNRVNVHRIHEYETQEFQGKKTKNKATPVENGTIIEQEIRGRVKQTIICGPTEKQPYDWAKEERAKKQMYDWAAEEEAEESKTAEQKNGYDDKVVGISKAMIKRKINEAKKQQEELMAGKRLIPKDEDHPLDK